MNKYTVYYSEYGKEKYMDCFKENVSELKRSLDYWQGAYDFERCEAPIINRIIKNDTVLVLENYRNKFNEISSEISKYVLPEMNFQDMSWAKPC